jgi:phospholipid transport system substrate-binding protein
MQPRFAIAAGLCLLATLAVAPVTSMRSATAADSPREVVRKLTDAVVAVLKQTDLSADARVTTIRDIVYDYADFTTISRLVLARNWGELDTTQKERFVEEFKKFLSISYGKNVESYSNEKVQIVGDRDEGRGDWTVQTKNLRPQGRGDVLVEYRLRQKNGEWKVIDVLIERVSLVSNYRSQFQVIMATGGIDHLLEILREKNASGALFKS